MRCSEPLVGPYNKRSKEDECLLDAFNPTSLGNNNSYRVSIKDGISSILQYFPLKQCITRYILGTKGYMIDTRTAAGIASSKLKGGGIEIPTCYPRWKRINRSKDSGPIRFHYLLESYSKVS